MSNIDEPIHSAIAKFLADAKSLQNFSPTDANGVVLALLLFENQAVCYEQIFPIGCSSFDQRALNAFNDAANEVKDFLVKAAAKNTGGIAPAAIINLNQILVNVLRASPVRGLNSSKLLLGCQYKTEEERLRVHGWIAELRTWQILSGVELESQIQTLRANLVEDEASNVNISVEPPSTIRANPNPAVPSEFGTLGWLLIRLERHEHINPWLVKTYPEVLMKWGREESQKWRDRYAGDVFKPNHAAMPGISRIILLCDGLANGSGLTAANIRALRAKVCRARNCTVEIADCLSLNAAADLLELTSTPPANVNTRQQAEATNADSLAATISEFAKKRPSDQRKLIEMICAGGLSCSLKEIAKALDWGEDWKNSWEGQHGRINEAACKFGWKICREAGNAKIKPSVENDG